MARMFRPDGQPVEVADDQVMGVFHAGAAGFHPNEQIPVVGPDGTLGYVAPQNASRAFSDGWRFDPASVKDAELQARYGSPGEQLKTAAESFASGATLGLSTVAERALGVKPEDIKGRREANPVVGTAGEVAGTIAPLLVTGGGSGAVSLTAKAARLAAKPMAAVVEAGKTTEALAKLMAPQGTSAIARTIAATLPAAAGSAVEGTLFGLGRVLDESALHRDGDPDLTAEHVLGTLGTSAVLGAGIGGGLKIAQLGMNALPFRANITKAMQRFFGGDAAKEKEFRELLLRQEAVAAKEAAEAAPAGLQTEFQGTAAPGGAVPGTPNPQNIAESLTGETLADEASAQVSPTALNALLRTGAPLDGALPLVTRSRRLHGRWDALARNPESADTMRAAVDKTTRGLEDFWDGNLAKFGDAGLTHEQVGLSAQRAVLATEARASAVQSTEEAAWRRLMGQSKDSANPAVQDRMVAAPEVADYLRPFIATAEKGGPKVPAPFQRLYDALGERNGMLDLDTLRAWRTEAGRNGSLGQIIHDADAGQWDGLFKSISQALGSASEETGPKAAAAWRKLNDNWQAWKDQAAVLRQVGNAIDGRAAYAAMVQRDRNWLTRWRTMREILPESDAGDLAAVHLRDLSQDPKTGRLNLSRWQTQWTALQPEERNALAALGNAGRQGLDDMLTIARAAQESGFLKNWSNTASATLFQDELTGGGTAALGKALRNPQSLSGTATTWVIDKLGRRIAITEKDMARMVTDPGFMAWAFTNPSAQKLADLERVIQASEKRLDKALKGITARPFFSRTPLVAAGTEAFRERDELPLDAYRRHWDELKELDADPNKLMARMTATTGDLPGVAPATSFAMQQKAAQMIQFLTEKAPKNPGTDDPLLARAWQPRDADVMRWGRYWEAANDPLGVVEAIAKGQLSREGVETLKTLYPKLYDLTVRTLMEQLTEGAEARKQPLPYAMRVQLSMLLQTPLDPSLQPARIAASQARFSTQKTAPGQGQPATGGQQAHTVRQTAKFRTLDQTQTETQRLESR